MSSVDSLKVTNGAAEYVIRGLSAAELELLQNTIVSITRSGTTFTAKDSEGNTLFTFTQKNDDTKNTAGTTNNANKKMYIVGAESQDENPQTYSNSGVYIGTDNCLYSNGKKVCIDPTYTYSAVDKSLTITYG